MKYKAVFSSDRNEYLAPCGPFDLISFTYPALEPELAGVRRQYAGNGILLTEAAFSPQRQAS